MSARAALAVVATVALAAVLLATGPGGRLANVDGDNRAPLYDRPLDDASLRRAGEIVPDDAAYYVAASGDSVFRGNLKAATQLYFAPALPVLDFRRADWYAVLRGGRVDVMPAP